MSDDLRAGLLFDMDGTLMDTNYLHCLAWSRAFRDAGEWAPMNAIHRLIGMGGDQLVPELLGHKSPAATAARPHRYAELLHEIRAFPDSRELLHQVHELGLVVSLATSAPASELGELRKVLDADDAIDGQTTADEVAKSKPDPEVFVTAMENASIDPRRALAIGDSVWDIRAARAAGIACITVETGGFSQHELSEAGSARVYRNVSELLSQLYTSPISALIGT
jgi:HAD superfamily hydrolase (TIGR01509 family)